LRFRFELRGERRVSIKALAELAGLHRDTLYELMLRRRASVLVRTRLSAAIKAIEVEQVRCRRRGQVWEIEGIIWTFEPRRHPAVV
jgi:hypothetical protein